MARKIQIMAPELANKIAAGEVIQRPASVVKELIENSIDAGATRIHVHVREAGKSLIHVIDDGEGMSDEDASMAFRRHATSKIRTTDDLEHIVTLGFRGEALASIAAVSHVEMKTRQHGDDLGTLIRIENDEIRERSKVSCDVGTSIAVKNLFYNTPARRNFLKTNQTELRNITDVVVRYALAYPGLGWKYTSDNEVLIDVKSSNYVQRIQNIFGKRTTELLLEVKEELEFLSLYGFIGTPELARKNRAEHYIFLNGRFIYSKLISHAVFQAYEHLLTSSVFPFFILYLTINPRKIDVNVHPSKYEVKFENESDIFKIVLSAVRRALAEGDIIPNVSIREGSAVEQGDSMVRTKKQNSTSHPIQYSTVPIFSIKTEHGLHQQLTQRGIILGYEESIAPVSHPHITVDFEGNQIIPHSGGLQYASSQTLWQVHNKYIISSIKSGLMIVDQHVAHERILYERVLNNFQNSLPTSQQLLFPETIELHPSEYALVKELQPYLAQIGFVVKLFGKNTVVLEGIPADVRIGNERKILQEVLDEYKANEHAGIRDIHDNLAKSFACKAAIKAGDPLTSQEMLVLIEQLFLTKMPYVCPHGRPVLIKIPLEELDKRFGRT
ncbi:MAG: DNA mismatch repair endonuclease MutL [Bacteroidetes bacterium]|nr:DNA mismatch repair endonuclease MutL [Bacteroidota bacterium]